MLKNFSKIIKHKKASKQFSILIGSLILLFLSFSAFLIISNLKKSQESRSQAANVSVTYSISVLGGPHDVGDVITATINMNPNGGKVSAADLFITFDQSHVQLLTADAISPLKELKNELIQPGLYRLAFVVNCTQAGCTTIQNQSEVAKVTFKILKAGSSTISFNSTKTLTAEIGSEYLNVTGVISAHILNSVTGGACTKNGDTNADGKVDGLDYALLFDNWGLTVPPGDDKVDFNCNKMIEGLDYVILFDNWTAS